jgi:hypothetical protein
MELAAYSIVAALVLFISVVLADVRAFAAGRRGGLSDGRFEGRDALWQELRGPLRLDLHQSEVREAIREEEAAKAWDEVVGISLEEGHYSSPVLKAAYRSFWRHLRVQIRALAHGTSRELMIHALRLQEACEGAAAVEAQLQRRPMLMRDQTLLSIRVSDLRVSVLREIDEFEAITMAPALKQSFQNRGRGPV